MNKLGVLAIVANAAPGILQVRRSTWIAIGVGLVVLSGLLIWAAVALIGSLWGQASNLAGAAPEALRGAAGGAMAQFEEIVPGVRANLGKLVPALKPETGPQRDVSGTDLGPVTRYPGLARSHWHREGRQAVVEYAGKADYATVLDHYTKGFDALGFALAVQSATPGQEVHECSKGSERFVLKIAQEPRNSVSVRIESTLQ